MSDPSYKALVLKAGDKKVIPIFIKNTYAYIFTEYRNPGTDTVNAGLREDTKNLIQEYYKDLSFSSRVKMIGYINRHKVYHQDAICFEEFDGLVAFKPQIDLLNILIPLVKKFNCMDILEKMLYRFGEVFIEGPKRLNPDVIPYIRHSDNSELSFEWEYPWVFFRKI